MCWALRETRVRRTETREECAQTAGSVRKLPLAYSIWGIIFELTNKHRFYSQTSLLFIIFQRNEGTGVNFL